MAFQKQDRLKKTRHFTYTFTVGVSPGTSSESSLQSFFGMNDTNILENISVVINAQSGAFFIMYCNCTLMTELAQRN